MFPLKKDKRFRQGIYTPLNQEKFFGKTAIYRSGLELQFMKFCDHNPNIVLWGSENIIVPYKHPFTQKMHRYYVDNFVVIKEGPKFDILKKYLIEIKPYKQTLKPKTKYRKKEHLLYEQNQYCINQSKWAYAREYCKLKGYEFKIITDKDIKS